MRKIPLTQGQEAIVDDHWYDYLMQWKWHAHWNPDTQSYYALRTDGKIPNRKPVQMSRFIANTPDGMRCDHINHNTLQNTEDNLRNATPSQNSMNRRIRKGNPTGVAGVSIRPENGKKYRAMLMVEGKKVLDKSFKTLEDATIARQEAEKKYFGEFSNAKFLTRFVD